VSSSPFSGDVSKAGWAGGEAPLAEALWATICTGAGAIVGIGSFTGMSTWAIPDIISSTSSRSRLAGTWAVKAKGSSSSTVVLVKRGEHSDQLSQMVNASIGVATMPTGKR